MSEETSTEQKIYLGPNISRLGMLRNQVYLGGIPGNVRAAIVALPDLEAFIVPISEMTDMQRKITTKGTHEHHAYTELTKKGQIIA